MPADHRLDLNLFRVLDAIYVHGGIGAAARQLHLTQPAVTHALNRLRAHFDDPLFVRQGNRVVPTERTRSIIADVQLHLKGLQRTARDPAAFDPATLELDVAVGIRDVLESIALPRIVAALAAEAPGVRLVSRRVAVRDIERELASGNLDLAIDRRVQTGARIATERLLDDALVVAMRRDHPLACEPLRRADYLAARHIAVSSLGEPQSLDVLLGNDGRLRHIQLVCQHYFAACQIAAAGDLLVTLPRTYALRMTALLPIAVQPLPLQLKPFPLLAYWHESRDADRAHRWVRKRIAALVRSSAGHG
ncbi:LysR family transcriptional regulator [Burkholderia dolosa]|uniref:LysR family transcriptional regulator n=1 Tax=Burkholderia dolosa TaxID=152500 RepID=A0A892I5S6_9BURK|nr:MULTISPECIES: LysR family transcriptional regulator [Burkholderia]AKE05411.1 LysR family transcriptional regulator [Burkholderia cepacia]AJY10892.1 bacterial regulatory helix-turn-helix, lysR family protein [Burkholderia dolosa AU0158]AYZ94272.1 LysR family transcriptional regulator [Burkholderia dolosa]MBR8420588.1 LysR family transcriptional regulator [Burkholderia dolosa]MBY4658323.1 LysR family transcriptional regulator [Burkholderia dolosa]